MYDEITTNPCPHCGGRGVVEGRKNKRVVCASCGARGPEKPFCSMAIEAWNQNVTEPLVKCRECIYYHSEIGWCDLYSSFTDDSTDKKENYTMFDDDDYCSRGKRKGDVADG